MVDKMHEALPVYGYSAQSGDTVALVNEHKQLEERLLRMLDSYKDRPLSIDQRWLAVGRTHLEQAFMAINRAIFQPQRIKLPEDPA